MTTAAGDRPRVTGGAEPEVLSARVDGRLIRSGSGEGAANMAVDAAILESLATGGPPTLRFYLWREPTLSLGYFQKVDDRALHAQSAMLPVVRRSTGGGAIVHDRELTYSLALPDSMLDRRQGAQRLESGARGAREVGARGAWVYEVVHGAVSTCLAASGIRAARFAECTDRAAPGDAFLCFRRRTADDLIVHGYKVLGSAQRRAAGGLIQHGSLLLQASTAASELPGIAELTGIVLAGDSLHRRIAQRLGDMLGIRWTEGELSAYERKRSAEIRGMRFASRGWTCRR